jgi:hypothetical protein
VVAEMPRWLHSLARVAVDYGTRGCSVPRPATWSEKFALWAIARLLGVLLQAGVWGRL